jgi:Holliday junction resolvase RusA-like endonuclease
MIYYIPMLKMSSALLLLSLFAVMDCIPTTKGFSDTIIPIRRSLSPRKNNNHTPYRHSVNINIRKSLLFSTTAKNVEKVVTTPNDESTPFSMERKDDDQWHWVEDSDRENLRINYRNDDDDDDNEEEDRQGENDSNNSKQISKMRFKIHGNPRPLQRHRTSRGHMYNPSLKYQKSFLNAYQNLTDDDEQHNIDMNIKNGNDYDYDDTPLFDANKYLAITIIFRMKRPKSHFINNKPGLGRIKKKALSQLLPIRTDVDNLAKFVLDSMNGVLYEDDKQIMSLHATKLLDNVGLCEGSTEIYIRTINGDVDMEKIIESSISNIDIIKMTISKNKKK